jgi:DNA polymerase III epsilon subunit family exonuclease
MTPREGAFLNEQLRYSVFQDVLFPSDALSHSGQQQERLQLRKLIRFNPDDDTLLRTTDLVVFDFETTGLDSRDDRIIEIGAIKLSGMRPVAEFSTLVRTETPIEDNIARLTGITNAMLADQPAIDDVLPGFIDFFKGSILVAHNAEFDMGFLRAACQRLGYEIEWPCFCTLKLARERLTQLEKKDLDSLAQHYGLTFEARHRSIGDVKVTCSVMGQMFAGEAADILSWKDIQPLAMVKD